VSGGDIAVTEAARQKALYQGADGRRWLASLGRLIRELEREWRMTVGPALSGGSEAYVAAAKTDVGEDAILKLEIPPYEHFEGEVRVLSSAEGRGYARLLDWDGGRHAMLLERLGPSLYGSGLPVPARVEILCATLRSAWEAPAPPGLQTGAEKARWLSRFIAATWEETGRPCSRHVVERTLAFAEARRAAFDPAASVLVHGDAADANALRAAGPTSGQARYKFVDPDGLLAEPAYDLGVLMREWSGELLGGDSTRLGEERCESLSRLTGVEPRAIWEWGFVERVSTGLLATRVGASGVGKEMLDVAEAWAVP
jgi:streptomycin 6-kinase